MWSYCLHPTWAWAAWKSSGKMDRHRISGCHIRPWHTGSALPGPRRPRPRPRLEAAGVWCLCHCCSRPPPPPAWSTSCPRASFCFVRWVPAWTRSRISHNWTRMSSGVFSHATVMSRTTMPSTRNWRVHFSFPLVLFFHLKRSSGYRDANWQRNIFFYRYKLLFYAWRWRHCLL